MIKILILMTFWLLNIKMYVFISFLRRINGKFK
jgi:hypothetical protein